MMFRNTCIFLLTISAVLLAWSTPSSAEVLSTITPDAEETDDWFFGISMSSGTYAVENTVEADTNILEFRLGREINDYVSVEGRMGFGFNETEVSDCGYVNGETVCANTRTRVREFFGVYARGHLMAPRTFRPYVLAGYTNSATSVALDVGQDNVEEGTTSGFSYGAGIETGTRPFNLTLEYISLFSKEGESADGFNLGFQIDF